MLGFVVGVKKGYLVEDGLLDNSEVNLSKKNPETFFFDDPDASALLSKDSKNLIVNPEKVNDYGKISHYFKQVNEALPIDGIFIGKFQSHKQLRRSKKIYKIPVIGNMYKFVDFGIHRVLPKIKYTGRLYFLITKGKRRRLTKTEVLGRLVRFGFSIESVKEVDNHFYFTAKKVNTGITKDRPSFGPLYKMPRIGQNGKIIHVYKLRTMHPYSEYLQDYVLKHNGYASSGKPANDFRLTSWGKIARKYWLDELPQLINVLKGEMKLLGVRPVSRRYFEDIPEHMRSRRLLQKPGCIPPYVALNRANSKNDVLIAEEIYLRLSKGKSAKLDVQLSFLAARNILFKGKRSA